MKVYPACLAAVLSAVASIAGITQAQEEPAVEATSDTINGGGQLGSMSQQQMFETLDRNGDGRLDPGEAGAADGDDPAFTVLDADGDGYISREEYGSNLPNRGGGTPRD